MNDRVMLQVDELYLCSIPASGLVIHELSIPGVNQVRIDGRPLYFPSPDPVFGTISLSLPPRVADQMDEFMPCRNSQAIDGTSSKPFSLSVSALAIKPDSDLFIMNSCHIVPDNDTVLISRGESGISITVIFYGFDGNVDDFIEIFRGRG